MQAPDRRSGKEGNDKGYQEAHAADQRFHDGPGLEGGLFVHAHKALHQPEAGVVEVGADGGTACNGSGDTGQVQRAQLAKAGHGGDDACCHGHSHSRGTHRDTHQSGHNEGDQHQRQAGICHGVADDIAQTGVLQHILAIIIPVIYYTQKAICNLFLNAIDSTAFSVYTVLV